MSHHPIGNHGLRNLSWAAPLRLSDGRLALVSFLSGGYNLHRFSDTLRLVTFVSFIKQTFCLLGVSTSCSHKHLCPLPTGVYFCQP